MPKVAIAMFLIGLSAALFGAWGQHTDAGRTRYDEMAGMIPYFSWWGGVILIFVSVILGIITAVRR